MKTSYPNLAKAMSEKNMKYTDLANVLGISDMGMYRRMTGVTRFTLPEAIQIAQVFTEYNITELFKQHDFN